ncbi:hypothetical protein V8E55_007113 [Tylopilus felleus]
MSLLSPLALAALMTTSYGSIQNNVNVAAGASHNMGISSNWDGVINVGTGCNGAGSCTTGGPTWNGVTPFSRAEFNFWTIPGEVTYDISLFYGYTVGMEISSADTSCDAFACTISSALLSLLRFRHGMQRWCLPCKRWKLCEKRRSWP